MALSLSSSFSLCYPPRPSLSFSPSASSSSSKTQKQLLPKTLVVARKPHLLLSKTPRILGFNLSTLPPFNNTNCRRSFTSPLTLEDATFQACQSSASRLTQHPTTSDDEGQPNDLKILENEAEPRGTLSLKSLINVYKEAVLVGDEKAISEVEAMICIVENEKNKLVQKLSAMSAEMTSGKEKYIRLQADFENFRKRTEKERLTIRSDAQGDVIESLLPMVDSFEKAKQQIKPETEKEKKIDTSYQGIYKQFVEILRSLRVAVVPTVGKRFDPSVHEAIAREESQEFKEGIVSQELRRGFLLGDRLVRPAMVKVSTGPRKERPTASTGQPTATAGVDGR